MALFILFFSKFEHQTKPKFNMSIATRREHDFLGEMDIPNELYYGIQTF